MSWTCYTVLSCSKTTRLVAPIKAGQMKTLSQFFSSFLTYGGRTRNSTSGALPRHHHGTLITGLFPPDKGQGRKSSHPVTQTARYTPCAG